MNSQNPILNDYPEQLETERLILRSPRAGDGRALFEAALVSLPEVGRWLKWAHKDYSAEEAEIFVRNAQANFLKREGMPLVIIRKSDGLFLGGTGLHHIDWDVPRFEIGYWLRTDCTGSGYMTEAVIAQTDFCRTQFGARRMTICCDSRNERSRQVAERAGYTLESITRNERRDSDDHTLRDMLCFTRIWPD